MYVSVCLNVYLNVCGCRLNVYLLFNQLFSKEQLICIKVY